MFTPEPRRAFEVKELSAETWPDFETLFGKHRGVRGGCWCTFHRCTSTQFDAMTRDQRKDFHHGLVYDGRGYGLLVYDCGIPVAWCQYGPAEGFPRYDRGRAYSKLTLLSGERPRWRISYLFADKHRRREGLAKFALHSAMVNIRSEEVELSRRFLLSYPELHIRSTRDRSKCISARAFEKSRAWVRALF